LKKFSNNTYGLSDGSRMTRSQIESRINNAKNQKVRDFLIDHDYYHCEACGVSSGDRFDCAHTKPVKECLENGEAELAWDLSNIRLLCRGCHKKQDKT